MASSVVQLLGNFFFPKKDYGDISYPEFFVTPTRIHLLLGFLSLSEKLYATEPPPYAGSIALRILSVAHVSADFGPTVLPALSLTLLLTHALQSRSLALQVFTASAMVWFSLQMENVAAENLENLLRAVGDPFLFTRDTSPPNPRSHLLGPDHSEPFDTAVVLIEFGRRTCGEATSKPQISPLVRSFCLRKKARGLRFGTCFHKKQNLG
jgi:hypothetical protein